MIPERRTTLTIEKMLALCGGLARVYAEELEKRGKPEGERTSELDKSLAPLSYRQLEDLVLEYRAKATALRWALGYPAEKGEYL